jgi:hypothetical protein
MILQDSPTGGITLLYGVTHRPSSPSRPTRPPCAKPWCGDDYGIEGTLEMMHQGDLGRYFDWPARNQHRLALKQAREILFPDLDSRSTTSTTRTGTPTTTASR